MSGIRWRPINIVQAQSSEAKKIIQIYRFGRSANFNCCRINKPSNSIIYTLNGGIPSAGGPALKNGGIPSAGGAKIYDGGKP